MRCDLCGEEGVRTRHMTRTYGKEKDLLIVENIPVLSCPHCGGSYLTAQTLNEIEQIKQNRQRIQLRQVAVASFV